MRGKGGGDSGWAGRGSSYLASPEEVPSPPKVGAPMLRRTPKDNKGPMRGGGVTGEVHGSRSRLPRTTRGNWDGELETGRDRTG